MIRATVPATLAVLLASLALAACDGGGSYGGGSGVGGGAISRSDAATLAACSQHADQVYDQRNRAAIYMPQSSVNTPYSANFTPEVTTRGLADRYSRDSMIRDCVRNTGTETDRNVASPPAAGAVVRP